MESPYRKMESARIVDPKIEGIVKALFKNDEMYQLSLKTYCEMQYYDGRKEMIVISIPYKYIVDGLEYVELAIPKKMIEVVLEN